MPIPQRHHPEGYQQDEVQQTAKPDAPPHSSSKLSLSGIQRIAAPRGTSQRTECPQEKRRLSAPFLGRQRLAHPPRPRLRVNGPFDVGASPIGVYLLRVGPVVDGRTSARADGPAIAAHHPCGKARLSREWLRHPNRRLQRTIHPTPRQRSPPKRPSAPSPLVAPRGGGRPAR